MNEYDRLPLCAARSRSRSPEHPTHILGLVKSPTIFQTRYIQRRLTSARNCDGESRGEASRGEASRVASCGRFTTKAVISRSSALAVISENVPAHWPISYFATSRADIYSVMANRENLFRCAFGTPTLGRVNLRYPSEYSFIYKSQDAPCRGRVTRDKLETSQREGSGGDANDRHSSVSSVRVVISFELTLENAPSRRGMRRKLSGRLILIPLLTTSINAVSWGKT